LKTCAIGICLSDIDRFHWKDFEMTEAQRKALDKEVLRTVKTSASSTIFQIEQRLRQAMSFPFDEFDVEDSLWRLNRQGKVVLSMGKWSNKGKK
jgi:hypothetical protein